MEENPYMTNKSEHETKEKMSNELKRIPYNNWINSQLSVAKYYGGITINGEHYEFDREELKKWETQETIYPDLVLYGKEKGATKKRPT